MRDDGCTCWSGALSSTNRNSSLAASGINPGQVGVLGVPLTPLGVLGVPAIVYVDPPPVCP